MHILHRNEIEKLIDVETAVSNIEDAYKAFSDGRINQPPVGHIAFAENGGDCHIKYGQIRGDDVFVIKIAAGFPENSARGIPTGNGLSLLISATTGEVKAILHDEMLLTDIRTAIGGAIASRTLAKNKTEKLLVVGAGVQSKLQIETHLNIIGNDMVVTIWGRSSEKAGNIAEALSKRTQISVSTDLPTACGDADIIVTTTGAIEPLIRAEWLKPGTHITAVGADAPGKQELDTSIIATADVLAADSIAQCVDHGEFEAAAAQGRIDTKRIVEIGAILSGRSQGRTNNEQITVADLTGLAAQDIAIAKHVLEAL